ncbi:glutathione binding-like protein [Rhizobium sp. L1K21]|nr:glutathione binding-like protein [Rhizobium sp. L1K21]MCO6184980.1 glutathione binding-like protein [Rhizobium sp. L1K21]
MVERARCNQLISIADNYAYPSLVWGIYVERIAKPLEGEKTDEEKVAAARPVAEICLKAISDIMGKNPWMAGDTLTLSDLYLAPIFHYFLMTEEGRAMTSAYPNLLDWWSRISARPSMQATRPKPPGA